MHRWSIAIAAGIGILLLSHSAITTGLPCCSRIRSVQLGLGSRPSSRNVEIASLRGMSA